MYVQDIDFSFNKNKKIHLNQINLYLMRMFITFRMNDVCFKLKYISYVCVKVLLLDLLYFSRESNSKYKISKEDT